MAEATPAPSLTGDTEKLPKAYEPVTLVLTILLSGLGAIIGLHLVTTLGISANTSVIGALIAMLVGRVSIVGLRSMRSVHRQNLAQSAISSATFAAANALLVPIAVPFAFGRPDLVWPMLVGAAAGLVVDAWMLYRIFDTPFLPAVNAWPPGIAAAETIIAGDRGGRRAIILAAGGVVGLAGSWFGFAMSAAGVALIGNMWALGMFGVGLLIAQYQPMVIELDLAASYIPHGVMVGAGVVALGQAARLLLRRRRNRAAADADDESAPADPSRLPTLDEGRLRRTLASGLGLFVAGAIMLALVSGVYAELSVPMLVVWVLLAGGAALVSEILVGLSAMHAGWFPAFAVTLIFLVLGLLIGIPGLPLALLVAYCASTGPAFADMGYDFKAGWMLRKNRTPHLAAELAGRRQQFFAGLVGCGVALVMVALLWRSYLENGQVPPFATVFADTIKAGLGDVDATTNLLLWAVPGALIQLVGGPRRQMGILLATGLLIATPNAGWLVLGALLVRLVYRRVRGPQGENELYLVGAGIIAGDSIASTAQIVRS